MKYRRWMILLLMIGLLLVIPVSAIGEASMDEPKDETGFNLFGFEFADIEITIGGIPMRDVLNAASAMFVDAVEENGSMVIDGLNGVFADFSTDLSGDLDEMGTLFFSMINDTWYLKIPAIMFDTEIRRSSYDSAMDLYDAQISGKTGRNSRIAMYTAEGCGNSIVYIYDEADVIPAIRDSIEQGLFDKYHLLFGLSGFSGDYAVCAVLNVSASEEAYALCNMTDLTEEEQFNEFISQINDEAEILYEEPLYYGDNVLTLVFWNQDTDREWLVIVAKEVPVLLD